MQERNSNLVGKNVLGAKAIHRNDAPFWFRRFYNGNIILADESRSDCPSVDDDDLLKCVNQDPHATTCLKYVIINKPIHMHKY